MKNQTKSVVLLAVCTLLLLATLSLVPNRVWDALHVRPINIFSDLLNREPKEDAEETMPALRPKSSQTKAGIESIFDYEEQSGRGMDLFYEALRSKENVRVAVFGDSFIEGDILIGRLRELLQHQYGGSGVGFVKIQSVADKFRPTIKQNTAGFADYCVMKGKYDNEKAWLSGYYFVPTSGASVELKGTDFHASLDTTEVFSIYLQTPLGLRLEAAVDDMQPETFQLQGKAGLQHISIERKGSCGKWKVPVANQSDVFYGVALDGKKGISVDNFSLRGSSGFHLHKCDSLIASDFAKARPYDLIILQYGMNFCQPRSTDYSGFVRVFKQSVEAIKKLYPNAAVLLVSMGDRGVKDRDGVTKTMPGVKAMVEAQHKLAQDEHIAFWNLYSAMGGENSMVKMVRTTPSLANKDYLHINFRGGDMLAKRLFDALQYGKEQYDERIEK
ncbi:MAG: hypothetical protein IJ553_02040 [Alloprevotella sp.]|nr:hypothetical protein [Alloprevotella sp.]